MMMMMMMMMMIMMMILMMSEDIRVSCTETNWEDTSGSPGPWGPQMSEANLGPPWLFATFCPNRRIIIIYDDQYR